MLYTRSTTGHRAGAAAAILPTIATVDPVAEETRTRQRRLAAEEALDAVLADSFPASDPPSWNPGFARPGAAAGSESRAERSESVAHGDARAGASNTSDVSRPNRATRTFLEGAASFAGAAGIALLVPFSILLVGLPVVLIARGLLEAIGWLIGVALP
jgi:hypothetical protein